MTPTWQEVDQEHLGISPNIPTTSGSPGLWYCSVNYWENPLLYTKEQNRPTRHEVPIQQPLLRRDPTGRTIVYIRDVSWSAAQPQLEPFFEMFPQRNIFVLQGNMSTNTWNLVHCLRSTSRINTLLVSCMQTYRKEGDASYWHSILHNPSQGSRLWMCMQTLYPRAELV